jgi:hypothetical protein
MDLADYFTDRKRECEQALKHAETSGFQFLELINGNWVDVTERRKQEYQAQIDEYQRCSVMFSGKRSK